MTLLGHDPAELWAVVKTGACAYTASKTAAAPLERVKLLLQTQDTIYRIHSGEVPRYEGAFDCFRRVVAEQGPLSLWRGNWPALLRFVPTFGFNFIFRDYFEQVFIRWDPEENYRYYALSSVGAGAASGVCALVLLHPFDNMRTRLACDVGRGYTREYRGTLDCFARSARLGGPLGALYAGFAIAIPGIVVYRGLYFGLYDKAIRDTAPQSGAARFAIAQVTTLIAGLAAYPLDTARRRCMLQLGSRQRMYSGGMECMYRILKDEGWRGWFKGAEVNAVRSIGAAAALWAYSELTGVPACAV
eukprot:TRINITY_DN60721_c0_g1_i1.p1 TRINITY_DN60721_c0_g1~~TRINITY_DN60721_c0_g1_i1.p1  ORF type:complete len:338 (+),score=79.54 TRINITY_DN60721_c0_g1_i1:109-1014(+)